MVVCKTCTFIYPQQSVQSMGQCISVCDCLPCCVGENELWKFRKKQILLFFGKAMVCLPFKVLSYLKTKKGVYCYWQLIGAEKVFLKKKIWCINMLKQRYQLQVCKYWEWLLILMLGDVKALEFLEFLLYEKEDMSRFQYQPVNGENHTMLG